jgi:hypothetical protein
MGGGKVMEALEIILAVIAPLIALFIFIATLMLNIVQRMSKVETNVNFMLKWIAALNGEMNDKKEFKDFLEQLKEVARGKGL